MKICFGAKFFAVLFAFLLASVLVPFAWHEQKFFPPVFVGASLDSFDRAVSGEEACFSYTAYPGNVDVEKLIEASAIVEDRVVYKRDFLIGESAVSHTACFPSSALSEGVNRVDVFVNNRELFFHVEKSPVAPEEKKPVLSVSNEGGLVRVSVENAPLYRVEPLRVFVDGELERELFVLGASESFLLDLDLPGGESSVRAEFFSESAEAVVYEEHSFAMNPLVGIILILLGIFAFALFLFTSGSFVQRTALSVGACFALIILLVFALNYADLLSPFSFAACFSVFIGGIAFFFRKKLSPLDSPFSLSRLSSMEFLVVVVFVLLVLLFNVFSYHHLSYWTPYYERQTDAVLDAGKIPLEDPLSYLGKGFTFIPGYFLLEAGFSWMTGLRGEQLFGLAIALSNFFFVFALFFLGKTLGFSSKKNALFYAFLCLSSFILTFFVVSPRHTFSFGFFILALALLFGGNRPWLSGFFAAMAGFIQVPLLAAFPLFYVLYSKKVDWAELAKALVPALLVFAVLFLPNILLYGMPTQAQSGDWGYLIKVDALRILSDIGAMLAFFFLFFAVDLLRERNPFGPYAKKLVLAFFLGVLIQMFITYRWNIFTALGLAILLVVMFPEKLFSNPHVERLLAILFLVAFWFVFIAMFSMTTSDLALQPMSFLERHSAQSDVILTDPLFGHSITYYVGAGVVADLAVEYVDPGKLRDSYAFLRNKDYSILEKYGVKFVVNQGDLINENATFNEPLSSPLEFEKLDKVYSDEFIFIHINTMKGD